MTPPTLWNPASCDTDLPWCFRGLTMRMTWVSVAVWNAVKKVQSNGGDRVIREDVSVRRITSRQCDQIGLLNIVKNIQHVFCQRKLGSNLPSYGQIELWDYTILNEGWYVSLNYITMRSVRLYSVNGGVCVCVSWTSHNHDKCESILHERCCASLHHICNHEKCEIKLNEWWCASLHHTTMRCVRLNSMNGGVRAYITQPWDVWDYTQWMVVCVSWTSHNK